MKTKATTAARPATKPAAAKATLAPEAELDKPILVEERRYFQTTGRHLENWRENPNAPLAGTLVVEYVPVKHHEPQPQQEQAAPETTVKKTDAPTGDTGGDTPTSDANTTTEGATVPGGPDARDGQTAQENKTEGEENHASQ